MNRNVLGEQAASVTGGLGFSNVIEHRRCVGEECVSKLFCMHLQRPYFMQVLPVPYDILVQDGCARGVQIVIF